MEKLRVRAFHVGFGDAILISVPDEAPGGAPEMRHILIDVGNVLTGEGGQNRYFQPVLNGIQAAIGGETVDLYVMTHEHLDHVQGLYYGSCLKPPISIRATHTWLTASAEGDDYYERFPDARKKHLALRRDYWGIHSSLRTLRASGEKIPPSVDALMMNNNPNRTSECIEHLKEVASPGKPIYVYRGCDLRGAHPFNDETTRLEIWAPEEDASDYYGRFHGLSFGTHPESAARPEVKPPAGVHHESFVDLIKLRESGYFEGLLAIDRAANNTSVVFLLEWQGWKLLFAGDAETRSWKTMASEGVLEEIHFLKVAHHGSENGMPREDILDKILPTQPASGRDRVALVSTFPDTYKDVPDDASLSVLEERGLKVVTVCNEVQPGGHVDLLFSPAGGRIETITAVGRNEKVTT